MKQGILVVDVGTSKVHVNLMDIDDGSLICTQASSYSWFHPKEGWSEVNPNAIWQAAENTVAAVVASSAKLAEIKAIAFSYIGDSLLPVDKEMNPIGNMILAFDARAQVEAREINKEFGADKFMLITGSNLVAEFVPAKLLWLRKNQPELFKQTARFWNIQQFFNYRLGLSDVTDFTLASRKLLMNAASKSWSPELCDFLRVNPEMLGTKITTADSEVGRVRQFGRARFDHEIPVILGAHDSESGMIGLGCIPGSDAVIGNITGTYDHVGYLTNEYIQQRSGFSTSYSGPIKDSFVFMGASIAGPSVDWFVNTFHPGEGASAIDRLFKENVFDGTNKIFLTQGVQTGDGTIRGINFETTPNDLFKAIVEGVTFPLKSTMELMIRVNGRNFGSMRVGGGGAKSDGWLQLKANMFNIQVERVKNIEISSMGAAIMAAVNLDYYHSFEDAMKNLISVQTSFSPSQEIVHRYNEKYEEYLSK